MFGMVLLLGGCGGPHEGEGRSRPPRPVSPPPAQCPARLPAPLLLPGIEARHRTPAYWLEHTAGLDEVLLSTEQIAQHDRVLAEPRWDGKPLAWTDLLAPVDPAALRADLEERLGTMRARITSGENVDARGHRLGAHEAAPFAVPDPLPSLAPSLHVALEDVQLRCGPRREGLYKLPVDPRFNRNNCSTAGAQEPIRVLLRWPDGPRFARTRHAFGWIDDDAALSPEVPAALAEVVARGPRVQLLAATRLSSEDGARLELSEGTLVPRAASRPGRVVFATAAGLHESRPLPEGRTRPTARPLTRRAVIEAAFARLDEPYGWGGDGGGLDCSGFVQGLFSSFGLELPRDSGRQALAGTDVLVVDPGKSEQERLALVDEAARRGVVLLHFPGHIMLYLGRDERGTPMAIHAFAEYLEPCPGGGETLRTVNGVTVSDLSLGRGTTRTAFLQRTTRIVVLGLIPSP
jgi:hypothetical protein